MRKTQERHPALILFDALTGPDSPFTATERLVGIVIANHFNGDERNRPAWPGVARLQAMTSLSRSAVKRAIEALCDGPGAILDRVPGDTPAGGKPFSSRFRMREAAAASARVPPGPGSTRTRSPQNRDRVHTEPDPGSQGTPNNEMNFEGNVEYNPPPKSPPLHGGARQRRYEEQIEWIAERSRDYGQYTNGAWRKALVDRLLAGEQPEGIVEGFRIDHEKAEEQRVVQESVDQLYAGTGDREKTLAAELSDFLQSNRQLTRREAIAAWLSAKGVDPRGHSFVLLDLRPRLEQEERRRGVYEAEQERAHSEDLQLMEQLRGPRAGPKRLDGKEAACG